MAATLSQLQKLYSDIEMVERRALLDLGLVDVSEKLDEAMQLVFEHFKAHPDFSKVALVTGLTD